MKHTLSRRRLLHTLAACAAAPAIAGLALPPAHVSAQAAPGFTLPPLPYPPGALEPHLDEQTMRIHHGRHHQAYVTNLNAALSGHPALLQRDIVDLLYRVKDVPEAIRPAVINNAGGHLNHSIFWATIGPTGGGAPAGALAEAVARDFGDMATLKAQLNDAATRRFGSGWAWLTLSGAGRLQVVSRANQDAPVMDGLHALLGVDVWEHAYYLKYQNRRADYLAAWWNVVNWEAVGLRYAQALQAI
jgi:Fe-Mn family superoxide dismutase